MKKKKTVLTPPDTTQCQARVPGNGPFTMGGKIGDPRDGYRVRCENKPDVIIKEKKPGKDGKRGSMSLCTHCVKVFDKQVGLETVTVQKIRKPKRP